MVCVVSGVNLGGAAVLPGASKPPCHGSPVPSLRVGMRPQWRCPLPLQLLIGFSCVLCGVLCVLVVLPRLLALVCCWA
jgi:hypothetical protein